MELPRRKLSPIPETSEEEGGGVSSSVPAPFSPREAPFLRRRRQRRSKTSVPRLISPNLDDLEAGEVMMDYRRIPVRLILKRNLAIALVAVFVVWLTCKVTNYEVSADSHLGREICKINKVNDLATTAFLPAFSPPEHQSYREPDTVDTFRTYKFRNHTDCQISSLDLHAAFSPRCEHRDELLRAFSGGGRVGFDRPFIPLDCDMRWFTTEEICDIFSRFEKVIVVGDSMMRHVVGALNVLLRKDLGYGAVTNWNFNDQELRDCFCNHQMDVKSCSVQGIFSTSSVLEHDPSSLACPSSQPIDLVIEMMLRFPLDPEEVTRFQGMLSARKPAKPYAFVFGHGLWNDLDIQATMNWLDGILAHALEKAPYLATSTGDTTDKNRNKNKNKRKAHSSSSSLWPRLFVTPNAAGIKKPDQWLVSQGDKALMVFEESVRVEARHRGVDALGTWNMSIQATKYDGVHLDLKGNLVKAMGVLNWLNLVDVGDW